MRRNEVANERASVMGVMVGVDPLDSLKIPKDIFGGNDSTRFYRFPCNGQDNKKGTACTHCNDAWNSLRRRKGLVVTKEESVPTSQFEEVQRVLSVTQGRLQEKQHDCKIAKQREV